MEDFGEFCALMVSLPPELRIDIFSRYVEHQTWVWKDSVNRFEQLCYDLSAIIYHDLEYSETALAVVHDMRALLMEVGVECDFLICSPFGHFITMLVGFDVPGPFVFNSENPDVTFCLRDDVPVNVQIGDSDRDDWPHYDVLISYAGVFTCVHLYTRMWKKFEKDILRVMWLVNVLGN